MYAPIEEHLNKWQILTDIKREIDSNTITGDLNTHISGQIIQTENQ